MLDAGRFKTRIEGLEQALHQKLGLRGRGLSARLARAGRLLPGRVRRAGALLVEAEQKLAHPKLALQLDEARLDAAFADIETHLDGIDPKDRRRGKLLGWLGGVVFNLILLVVLVLLLLKWRGVV